MKKELRPIEAVNKSEAITMSSDIINSLNEAKNRLKMDLDELNQRSGFSTGYLSQILKSTSCPLLTACTLAIATGKRIVVVD